ncbi:MAG: TonB-dependent receptor [candidate division Zixibacteria bacterium]|nr:TonB-dependent receptor [candidate division Zixibacteria bacterium]
MVRSVTKNVLSIVILMLIAFPSYSAFAFTINGIIKDADTGESLAGAIIYTHLATTGWTSDDQGRFVMHDVPDDYIMIKLHVHLIGYKDQFVEFTQSDVQSVVEIFLAPSPWKMDNVVVTGTRRDYILKDVPVTTELITSEEFKKTGSLSVDEALDSQIGIEVFDDLSGKGLSLRGVDPKRVLVLIDGNRAVGRIAGSLDLGQFSLGNIKQIEIVKGSGSTLYGSDAIGGVVNIITRNATPEIGYNFYSSYGSYNSYDFQAGVNSGIIGSGLNLIAKYEHTDGFDLDESTEHTNGIEEIDRFNVNGKTSFNIKPGWNIDVTSGFMMENKNWIETETMGGITNFDDDEENFRIDAAVKSRWSLKEKADFSINIHGTFYDHTWEKFGRPRALIDQSHSVDDLFAVSMQYNRMLADKHILTFGGDAVRQSLDSDQLASGKEEVVYSDLYAQYEWRLLDKYMFLPGIRWEHHETYGDHFNPSMNVMWDACSYFNLRGSVSRGFRAPSIKELYFEFDHSAAGVKVSGGGDDLEPEKSWNYSLTGEINYRKKAVHRLTYFRNDLDNLIDYARIDPSELNNPSDTLIYFRGIYRYDNVLKAKTQGIEWETEINLYDDIDLSFSYTFMTAKDLGDDPTDEETDLVNRPEHIFKFYATYAINAFDTRLNLWGNWQDQKLWEAATGGPGSADSYAPSRFVLNAGVDKKVYENLSALVKVFNVTDETDAEYAYWPQRSFSVSLRYNF